MNNTYERAVPIVVEQHFNKRANSVWAAITEQEQMVKWFFDSIPEFKPEVGFETSFDVDSGNRIFRHNWKIIEADAPSKIVYLWSYEDIEGAGTVTFKIFEQDDGALVRVINEGLDNFPENIPEFSRESCIGGWEYFIQDRLKQYLDG